MVNPGTFRGSRAKFLQDHKESYALAIKEGRAKNFLVTLCRKYFKRYPIELPHDEEPSEEHLQAVDDNSPDPEYPIPEEDALDPEKYSKAIAELEERRRLIVYRKSQICRRMAYMHMKDHNMDPLESDAQNPYKVLLHQLTGTTLQKPRLKTAANVWRRTHREEIENEALSRAGATKLKDVQLRKKLASLREKVAKELYGELPAEEKAEWERLAKEEHDEAIAKWEAALKRPPSTEPADRQRCIQALVHFVEPILDGICAATGWKATLIAGGPEPADEGRLNIVSVHSGSTRGDIKMNFSTSEQKCYTVEECKSRSLPSDEGFEYIAGLLIGNSNASVERGSFPTPGGSTPIPTDSSPVEHPPIVEGTASGQATAARSARLRSPPMSLPPSRNVSPLPSPAYERGISPVPSAIHSPLPSPSRSVNHSPLSPQLAPPLHSSGIPAIPSVIHSPPPSRDASPVLQALPSIPPITQVASDSPSVTPSLNGSSSPSIGSESHEANSSLPLSSASLSSTPTPPSVNLESDEGPKVTAPNSKRKRQEREVDTATKSVPPRAKKAKRVASRRTSKFKADDYFERSRNFFLMGTKVLPSQETEELGSEWVKLVEKWAEFEVKLNHAEMERLPCDHRPNEVAQWVKRARDTWYPTSIDAAQYAASFDQWWATLQPDWRLEDGEIQRHLVEGDWSDLRRSGKNGLIVVVAALFFWGLHAWNDETMRALWLDAVRDCDTVISCL
ncbi:hypothetical protein CVT24_010043 [Panaeolus cyanescens]|uniref:Uncharacterized protein n=1 Tax=Panaeolus cyanescens TaxID=181874 RepID=A0A409WLZ4_9AGAR|nr:hypothetical protein CVT24_010043 [Panaeolus cyanescens]